MKNTRVASLLPRVPHTFLVALTFGLLALTNPSAQAVTLTLNDPNPTLVVPSSGSITHTFTGTLSFDPGFSLNSATLLFPFINGGAPGLFGNNINFPYSDANEGGTFSGGLFTIEIFSTSPFGSYNQRFGGGPATFGVSLSERQGNTTLSASAPYTVTLVPSAGVPDGGGTLLLLVGALGTLGWIKRREP